MKIYGYIEHEHMLLSSCL